MHVIVKLVYRSSVHTEDTADQSQNSPLRPHNTRDFSSNPRRQSTFARAGRAERAVFQCVFRTLIRVFNVPRIPTSSEEVVVWNRQFEHDRYTDVTQHFLCAHTVLGGGDSVRGLVVVGSGAVARWSRTSRRSNARTSQRRSRPRATQRTSSWRRITGQRNRGSVLRAKLLLDD